ncbi:MAG: flagellar hook-basal body complex protein [Candidatus Syntrophopropionicum ammoniitolerans]
MKNHQIRMDVISNNIANVNTTGFKSSRANFEEVLVQTLRSPSGPSDDGGLGYKPVPGRAPVWGWLVLIWIWARVLMQSTGRSLDLAIEGNGFFQVTDGTNTFYTRNGVFYIDTEGYLVDGNGYRLSDGEGGGDNPGEVIQLVDDEETVVGI